MSDLFKDHNSNFDRVDFEQIGIDILTSESDGTNMGRLLCDLNDEGIELVREFFGGCVEPMKGTGHNNHKGATVLLTREMLQELMIYWFLKRFDVVLWLQEYFDRENHYRIMPCVSGLDEAYFEQHHEFLERLYSGHYQVYRKYGNARDGVRNQHAMTGRIE